MSIDVTQSKIHIAEFLSRNNVGVLATVDATGAPHAATVYFTYDHDLSIYFLTKKDTQKNRNLENNGRAAVAIFEPTSQTTVQAEGTVVKLTDEQRVEGIITEIWSIARATSKSGVPPTSSLSAGGYTVYKLAAPSLRMATFTHPGPAEYADIFETVTTQPS